MISRENIASKLRQLSGNESSPEVYEFNKEFRYNWDVEPVPEEAFTYFQDFVLVDERAEGRLFRGLPMPKDFYTTDAQQYAGFPFVFVPNGLDINWVSLQRPSYFAAPCAFIRKFYIEADLLLWSSMSGWSIPEYMEWIDREQFEDGPLYR